MKTRILSVVIVILFGSVSHAQVSFDPDTVKTSPLDYGKMWTFDFPPTSYFEKTYQFAPTQEWFDQVRKGALRLSTGCSASFVSANGLVLTNQHCAREVVLQVQNDGESFMKDGFYANTPEEERKIPGLYADQLVLIEDITARVQQVINTGETAQEKMKLKNEAIEAIKKEYEPLDAWKGLVIEPVTLYHGARYSLYGYKRYKDVRLVMMPELNIVAFGGEYDNFTYPRYSLDFTFLRVYDDPGKPYKPGSHFKFNPDGIKENELVFTVGNPGETYREQTVATHEYKRDVELPLLIDLITSRSKVLQAYTKPAESDSINNLIFRFGNVLKAISGQLAGLRNPYVQSRKKALEKEFKNAVLENGIRNSKDKESLSLWKEIAAAQNEKTSYFRELMLFNPFYHSQAFNWAFKLNQYALSGTGKNRKSGLIKVMEQSPEIFLEIEKGVLTAHFKEVIKYLDPDDAYVKYISRHGNPDSLATAFLQETRIYDPSFRKTLLEKGAKVINESEDPILQLTRMVVKEYGIAPGKLHQLSIKENALRADLSSMLYEVYGTSIPPDANFTLRISDGVVKQYQYNHTKAPIFTTFYGMYDRYHSFGRKHPWELPESWENPPADLLKSPLNFISTTDIAGGNSGSPVINKDREVVGLVFDHNVEALPGYFLYLPEKNRTISVHAGGILASLKYIYHADRVVNELVNKSKYDDKSN